MKKKRCFSNMTKWALFMFLIFGLGFSSCESYDDDIDDLQNQINSNASAIAALQQLAQDGKFIQKVVANNDGTGIILTDSNGTSYEIKSGTNGSDGKDGIDGAAAVVTIKDGYWYINGDPTGVKAEGTDGKDGVNGSDGKDGVNGTDGKDGVNGADGKDGVNGTDGKDGTNGKDGANGKDGVNGADGKDGVSPVISIIDGYWAINGVKTNQSAVPANGGTIIVDDTDPTQYKLTIKAADGKEYKINLSKSASVVTSINFVPKFYNEEGDASTTIIPFPYIKTLNGKRYEGKAVLSYVVNPSTVPLTYFDLVGFSKKNASLLKSANTDSNISIVEGSGAIANGVLSFKAKAANFSTTGKDYLALVVKNKNAATEEYVYSEYIPAVNVEYKNVNLVKEDVKKVRTPLILTTDAQSTYPTKSEHFQILYSDQTGYNLVDSLAAYFVGMPSPDYLKDNGFDDYTYEFTAVNYEYEGVNQTARYLVSNLYNPTNTADKPTAAELKDFKEKGRIKVTKDPDNLSGNRHHFAAINRTPIVKVDLKSPNGDIIISRIIKIKIVQTITSIVKDDIKFGGDVSYERACLDKEEELDLDKLFNNAGVQMGKVEFFNTYTYQEVTSTTGYAKGLRLKSEKDKNKLLLTIPNTIPAGTYVVSGTYTASGRAKIIVTYNVTITNPAVKALTKNPIWWTTVNGKAAVEITGRANVAGDPIIAGTKEWFEEGQISTAFVDPKAELKNASNCPTVALRYWLADANGKRITTLNGVKLNELTGQLELANTAAGKAYVNHDYNNLKNPVRVMVVAIYDGNEAVFEVMQPAFDVYFKSPVLALTNLGVADKLKDKYDNTVNGYKFFKLMDFKNQTIYENGVFDLDLQDLYDVTFKGLKVNKYTDVSGKTVSLVANKQKLDVADPTNIEWINTGENLQQAIIAVIDVEFEHKWGTRSGQIKIQIDPLP